MTHRHYVSEVELVNVPLGAEIRIVSTYTEKGWQTVCTASDDKGTHGQVPMIGHLPQPYLGAALACEMLAYQIAHEGAEAVDAIQHATGVLIDQDKAEVKVTEVKGLPELPMTPDEIRRN